MRRTKLAITLIAVIGVGGVFTGTIRALNFAIGRPQSGAAKHPFRIGAERSVGQELRAVGDGRRCLYRMVGRGGDSPRR